MVAVVSLEFYPSINWKLLISNDDQSSVDRDTNKTARNRKRWSILLT